MAQVRVVRKSPPPIPGTATQTNSKQSEIMRLAQTLNEVSVDLSKQENEVENPKTLQEQYPNRVLFNKYQEDEVEKYIKSKRGQMNDISSNAVNAEFCSTAMGIVLAFLTGGLFLPFLLYHLLHGDKEVKKVKSGYNYLYASEDLNATENLTEEDKQHFYDHPMDYKVGLNRYEEFKPESENLVYIGDWGYKSKNPRFAKDEGRDLWWNKPYWDIVAKQHKIYTEHGEKSYKYNALRYYQRKILFERGEVPIEEVEYWEIRCKEIFDCWADHESHMDPGSFMCKYYWRERRDGLLPPEVLLESYHRCLDKYNKDISKLIKENVENLLINKFREPYNGFHWESDLSREESDTRINLEDAIYYKMHLDLYKNYFKELTGEEFPEEEA